MERLKDWEINWLVVVFQFDVMILRKNYRKVIIVFDIFVYMELVDELYKYKFFDMEVLNSLILNNQYEFEVGNKVDVYRYFNVYMFYMFVCKSDNLLLCQVYINWQYCKNCNVNSDIVFLYVEE